MGCRIMSKQSSPKNPVTSVDVDKFDEYIQEWQTKLNLNDWRIVRSPKRINGAMAQVAKMYLEDRLVSYKIGTDFGSDGVTDHTLESTAVHELLHILLFELVEVAATPGHTQEHLMSVEHRVVNTLEGLLVPKPPKQ